MPSRRARMKAARSSRIRERSASTKPTSSTLACQERNLPTCSSTMTSARGTSLSRLAILLHNFGEVVDVIDVKIVEIGGSRLDVARNAQIHEEEGAIGTSGHGLFQNLARDDRFFRSDRGDDHVGGEERGLPVAPVEDAAAELLGQRFGAVAGAVHDEEMRDAAVAQGRDDLLADG